MCSRLLALALLLLPAPALADVKEKVAAPRAVRGRASGGPRRQRVGGPER
jgi:hypothetical protein